MENCFRIENWKLDIMKENRCYTTHEVHLMLNERACEKISEYHLRVLQDCWRISRKIAKNVDETGFTEEEAKDFIEYAY